mmetsp:Transcript_5603/g.14835  ORF Transcript_5603/g.14835 Transcript_5603/m.14835 type:complete len:354 (-) Transcript_5603:719-1780(-)
MPRRLLELVERLHHETLRLLPRLWVAERRLGLRRELEGERHTKVLVHGGDHVERAGHLRLDLRHHAEDVCVILLEASHPREACESAGELIAVKHAKVSEAHRELAVGALAVLEHEAVAGTVHRLQPKLLPLDVEKEHVLLVLGRVARRLPQLEVVHVGRDDLHVVTLEVLLADEVDEAVVDAASMGEEEARAGRELVEEEKLLLHADDTVVTLGRLGLQQLPLLEFLLVREGDAVHALQLVVALLAEPERGRGLGHLESLHARRVRQVRPLAQVDERPALVDCRRRAVWQLRRDHRRLEGVGLEELEALLLGDDDALERLLRVRDLLRLLLERRLHVWRHRRGAEVGVVEEAT